MGSRNQREAAEQLCKVATGFTLQQWSERFTTKEEAFNQLCSTWIDILEAKGFAVDDCDLGFSVWSFRRWTQDKREP